ncbi:MAG: hypothetical protein R2882_12745 [Gemmatimonadales bacterium]
MADRLWGARTVAVVVALRGDACGACYTSVLAASPGPDSRLRPARQLRGSRRHPHSEEPEHEATAPRWLVAAPPHLIGRRPWRRR